MMEPVDVSVVIVSWNVCGLLRRCIESILSADGPSVEIIVIDNASADGSAEMLRAEFPQVDLIASDVNLGFSRANNVGLAHATGEYVFFLNPDTIVRNDALTRMVAFLGDHSEFDMIGPRLVSPDGIVQPVSRLPSRSVLLMLSEALYLHRLPIARALMKNRRMPLDDLWEAREVEAVSGAAMFARRRVLNELAGFDESFLYTCEDLDLCVRLGRRGSRIFYLVDAEVVHFSGQSSSQASVRSGTMSILSMERYLKRSYSGPTALAYRLIVQVLQMPIMVSVGVVKAVLRREGANELRDRLRFAKAIWRWRVSD
jgi:N-acetylglucosaminyl-diphospho-decaprenol L-rhamnosyltransferase